MSEEASGPATFRAETRAWLEENCPPSLRRPMEGEAGDVWGGRHATFALPEQKVWLERAAARGITVPRWPREYGGAGLSSAEAAILDEEMRRMSVPTPLKSFGIWMLGPVLLQYGTDEQKREHLPKIARGEIRWCQGYSEPGAGSDLASLAMSGVRDGDHFVVNGQKIWTSYADKSDWIFCLVRTEKGASKQEGISFLLIDMETPGVSTRPIRLISGYSPFCETFFTDVRVPAANLLGPPGGGWTIAKALLQHERTAISNLRDPALTEESALHELALRYLGTDDSGRLPDAGLRDRITHATMDFLCTRLTLKRSSESQKAGRGPGAESSMFKLYGSELNKRRKELKVLIAGYRGLGWESEGDTFSSDELRSAREWLRSRANSIEGGTSEIQLNIIAKRVLGLPD